MERDRPARATVLFTDSDGITASLSWHALALPEVCEPVGDARRLDSPGQREVSLVARKTHRLLAPGLMLEIGDLGPPPETPWVRTMRPAGRGSA